ncbi:hypothetical protein, conserved [Eimeria praecox]|uniref:Uncharacterized protein n=1 Tax=Eimeria praecox TaxID=51316 RepID=U6H0J6_9EIME|nr:hypothetical protein, conserved [Eimeria praecox]
MGNFTKGVNEDKEGVVAARGEWETGRLLGEAFRRATLHARLHVGSGIRTHARPVIKLTEGKKGLLLATVARSDVVVVAVEEMGEGLGQGGNADSPTSVNADVQIGVVEPEEGGESWSVKAAGGEEGVAVCQRLMVGVGGDLGGAEEVTPLIEGGNEGEKFLIVNGVPLLGWAQDLTQKAHRFAVLL